MFAKCFAFAMGHSDDTVTVSGTALARGTARHMLALGRAPLAEFVPSRGLRVDVIALAEDGEIWVIECKSSRADFMADHKWERYLPWCDRFFWAVAPGFPQEILPGGTGLMLSDGFDAEILRFGPEAPLAAARRKALTRKIARTAAERLARHRDPGVDGGS